MRQQTILYSHGTIEFFTFRFGVYADEFICASNQLIKIFGVVKFGVYVQQPYHTVAVILLNEAK